MHRAITRCIRGTCRKWRENECPPVVGSEDVRKGGNKKNEEFVPPTEYSLKDAVGWTAGLVLAYEFTHRRRRTTVIVDERPQSSSFFNIFNRLDGESKCPFGWPTKAISQPIIPQTVYVKSTSVQKKSSIDLTPFLHDDVLLASDFDSTTHQLAPFREDEDIVQFSNDAQNQYVETATYFSKYEPSSLTPAKQFKIDAETPHRPNSVEKLTGDLLGALGAFKFMKSQERKEINPDKTLWTIESNSTDEPPLTAVELMEQGASLGSARALYNIGASYERLNEIQLAREYFRKAADLGHPLATYNHAVYLLREGKISDGFAMMKMAAESGVPEAKKIVSVNT